MAVFFCHLIERVGKIKLKRHSSSRHRFRAITAKTKCKNEALRFCISGSDFYRRSCMYVQLQYKIHGHISTYILQGFVYGDQRIAIPYFYSTYLFEAYFMNCFLHWTLFVSLVLASCLAWSSFPNMESLFHKAVGERGKKDECAVPG